MECEQTPPEPSIRERAEAALEAVRSRFDVSPYWEGIEWKRWVVSVEAGPYKRKKPAFSTTIHVSGRNKAEAIEAAKRQLWQPVRRPSFSARLAHPVNDLGMTPAPALKEDNAAPLGDGYGLWCITCKCGHRADIEAFCRSPRGVALPRNEYQCPKCFCAWTVRAVSEGWLSPDGHYLPPRRACVAILPRL